MNGSKPAAPKRAALFSARSIICTLAATALILGPSAAVQGSTGTTDSTFSAPAQRSIVHFDAPTQRTPEPLAAPASADTSHTGSTTGSGQTDSVSDLNDQVTGLGPATAGRIPEGAEQVLVASGADDSATQTELNLWEKKGDQWERTATMSGRNGGNGWKEDRREGDRTTPAGVFSLSDAGGYLADPGSHLPYYRDEGLRSGAQAVYGDGYASVFDYVIAIDYNRKTGVAPTENTRPMGWDAGGKIWLHVEHGNPTRGCVALAEADMKTLLTTLDPDKLPHIAMGSEEFLAR